MNEYFLVVILGAVGVSLRYGLDHLVMKALPGHSYLSTFGINIVGSFLIGTAFMFLNREMLSPWTYRAIAVGLLGGFTTFSAYSLQTYYMFTQGEVARALMYSIGSPILGILSVALAFFLFR